MKFTQYSLKFIKYVIAVLIGILIGRMGITTVVYPDAAVEVIKTAAHLTVRNPDFELIASYPEEDIAYYRRINTQHAVYVDDIVTTYRGEEAVVTDVTIHGFTVHCEYLTIGDSGTVIRNEYGEQVGFVDKILGDGLCYCIWT